MSVARLLASCGAPSGRPGPDKVSHAMTVWVVDCQAGLSDTAERRRLPCPLHDWGRRSGFLGGHVTILPGISQSAPA